MDWHRRSWKPAPGAPPLRVGAHVRGEITRPRKPPAAELNERRPQSESRDEQRGGQTAEMRPVQKPRHDLVAQGPQAPLQVQGLCLRQVQPHRRATARHGSAGKTFLFFQLSEVIILMCSLVICKRCESGLINFQRNLSH